MTKKEEIENLSDQQTGTTEEANEVNETAETKPAIETTKVGKEETPVAEEVNEAASEEANLEEVKEPKAEEEQKETEAEAIVEEVQEPVEDEAKKEPAKKTTDQVEKPVAVEEEEFDWDNIQPKGFGDGYSNKEKGDLAALYEGTLNEIQEREVIKGTIVSMTARDVILNIGFKSDGLVSASEFRDMPDLKPGDEVEVYIEEQEDANGQLVLSRRKAKIVSAWENIQSSFDNDLVIDGFVKRRTKGGLIVDIFGVEAFLPGSQIDVKPIRDFDIFVDKKMEVKVVKINHSNDNVVVSHKILIEKDLEKQRAEILNNLEKGQVLEGVVKNMTNFGVFIDLGGVDGLLHITDISWGRVGHPEDVMTLDEKVNIVVLDFDDDKRRISLGMKQLTEHPWDSLDETIDVGTKVKGKVVNVADYGAFLEIQPGVEGLIHVSEMSWSQHLRNPQDFNKIGDQLEAVVLTINREDRKMSLGIKQLTEDPWTKQDILTKYGVGTDHTGIVRNLTNFGLFIELEEGIDGLVHVSDLSWTKKVKHPSEFVNVSENLEVRVLELDVENRRLALGHKQLEENPWDTFESVFTRGSLHKCAVTSVGEKGALLELPYGLEGFCPNRNFKKEDGSKIEVNETLDFVVTEFSKEDKRIVLSHVATYSKVEEKSEAKKKGLGKNKAVAKLNSGAEKSTLGDLEALSALKDKMEGSTLEAKPAEKSAAEKASGKAKKTAKNTTAKVSDDTESATTESATEKKKAAPKAKKAVKEKATPEAGKETPAEEEAE